MEQVLFQINMTEFLQVMQLLEKQQILAQVYNQLPLVRERID
jgi:hypothetical protein